jgi:hypothetical protein
MQLQTAVVPFQGVNRYSESALMAKAARVSPTSSYFGKGSRVYGTPGLARGLRLGNMPAVLSDYINSPGTPGSSSFYLYGLAQDDSMIPTDYASSAVDPSTDVTTSSSPSFFTALQQIATSAAEAAKTIVPAVIQQQNVKNAAAALRAGQITPYQYQQITSQPSATFALAPSAGLATGLKISGATLAVLAAAGLFLFMRKR